MIAIGPTLEELGIASKPEATLVRDDAFFVLVDDLLIYRDDTKLRRVSLRDLTRIHSDDTGLLRVETPVGAALQASLMGFDPDAVQPFFLRVRDATAYAKAQAKRAREREQGTAPASPFARVPRAEPQSQAQAQPQSQPVAAEAGPSEKFEPYAPHEQPRSFGQQVGERLGSVVRVIRRQSQAAEVEAESSQVDQPPVAEAPVAREPEQPRPAPSRPAPAQPQPSPASQPAPTARASSAPPRPAAAPKRESVSMEEVFRAPQPPAVTGAPTQRATQDFAASRIQAESASESVTEPIPVTEAVAEQAEQPQPKTRTFSLPKFAVPKRGAPVSEPVEAAPSRSAPARPAQAEAAAGKQVVIGAEPQVKGATVLQPAAPKESLPSKVTGLFGAAGQPKLSVWPTRLRMVAALLLVAALYQLVMSFFTAAALPGFWLLMVSVAIGALLLAAADVVQVLALRLGEVQPEDGKKQGAGHKK